MIRRFLNVVPRGVQLSALILVVCGTVVGVAVGALWQTIQHLPYDPFTMLRNIVVGVAVGLLFSSIAALWLLCVGYVYADARRRAMRPVLWVVVVILFPHLLGFLLYFVLRQPIASLCARCGMTVWPQQRFCSWCGSPQAPATSGDIRFPGDPLNPSQPLKETTP